MRYLLTLILCLIVSSASGQIKVQDSVNQGDIKNLVQDAVNKLVEDGQIRPKQEEVKPKIRSIDDELVVLLADLAKYPPEDKYNWVYFSFYHIDDPQLLKKFYLALTFWVHSLSSESLIKPPQPVEGSPTLFKVDIRDYGWNQKAWEKVSIREPYIREPWIPHDTYSVMRIEGGNNLIRGDWFLAHTSSPVKQLDIGDKEILYETLLYAQLGRSPKNLQEFYDYWGYDVKKIETKLHKVEQILVPHGKSGVAQNNRILARVSTELGYFYSSSDFLNSTGKKNVIENLYPDIMLHPNRDAGEHIGQNKIGLQHYLVTDDKDNNVWVANERVAFDRTNVRDVTVMAGKSCVICHSQGLNIPYNGLQNLLEKQVKLRYADKAFKLASDRTYFGPLSRIYDKTSERQTLMEKDRENYNDAVKDVNGLDASTNALYFKEVLDWYEDDITLERAARECGVTVEEFQDKVTRTATGELGALANGSTVGRVQWEDPNNGLFAQSMLLLKALGKTIIQTPYQNVEIVPDAPAIEEVQSPVYITLTQNSYLKIGTKNIAQIQKGTKHKVLDIQGNWYKIKSGNQTGYIYKKHVVEE